LDSSLEDVLTRKFLTGLLSLLVGLVSGAVVAQDDETFQLAIIHTSSTYNHITEFTPFGQPLQGGMARVAAAVGQLRAEHPHSILVSAGRDVPGTSMFTQYGGVAAAEVMSRIGYDVALAAEMDLGAGGSIDAFQVYNALVDYPLLGANLDLQAIENVNIASNTILDVGGVPVGLFGLAHESSSALTNLGDALGVRPTAEVIEENLAYFAAQDVKIVVLLSTLGVARDFEVAETYGGANGIDVIIGNDSSAVLGDPANFAATSLEVVGAYPLVFNETAAPTVLVYGGRFGAYVGDLELTFDENGVLQTWGGGLLFMNEAVAPDPELQAYIDELAAGINLDAIIIGETSVDLHGDFRDTAWQENALQNLYADALLDAGREFEAEIALVNAGAGWGSLLTGEVTFADLTNAQPFFNWLVVTDLTGAQVVAALEHGVSNFGASAGESGAFPHVAGMTFTVDATQAAGQRIRDVMIAGEPVDLAATYTLAVSDFLVNGGDGYAVLLEGMGTFNTGLTITDIVQNYIEQHSPLVMPEMGRMTIIE
jgi:5'-nucleotidase